MSALGRALERGSFSRRSQSKLKADVRAERVGDLTDSQRWSGKCILSPPPVPRRRSADPGQKQTWCWFVGSEAGAKSPKRRVALLLGVFAWVIDLSLVEEKWASLSARHTARRCPSPSS